MYVGMYNYKELRDKALKTNCQEDINNLGEWFDLYGRDYWNGETYDMDNGMRLRPIYGNAEYDDDGEIIQEDVIGYEITY